jgi:Terpene cyclase DEP1
LKYVYGLLSLLGIALPYSQFIPWVRENGLNFSLLIDEAIQTRISSFARLDVIVSAIVLVGFILYEGKRIRMRLRLLWIPIIGTLTVGVSFGLPVFLFLRELHIEKRSAEQR